MNRIFIFIILLFLVNSVTGQKWIRLHDFRGIWKFAIGDEIEWSQPDFDDSKWDNIFVPSSWEDEGFPGYDGFAWYRKSFKMSKNSRNQNLYLRLGYIDDVNEVFVNGILIGASGSFPPHYKTAYGEERVYVIPAKILNINEPNCIAVRIYDRELTGGLLKGNYGIYLKKYNIDMAIPLEGFWKFKTGDNSNYKRTDYNDKNWIDLFVPETWEKQGIFNYDGIAWYRRNFIVPEKLIGEKLVLLLGKIDDFDETFFNGFEIGNTGIIFDDISHAPLDGEWLILRAYQINNEYINFGGENVIAVRVYDDMVDGGIYQGPVGIVTYENYIKWKPEEKKRSKGFFEWLFDDN